MDISKKITNKTFFTRRRKEKMEEKTTYQFEESKNGKAEVEVSGYVSESSKETEKIAKTSSKKIIAVIACAIVAIIATIAIVLLSNGGRDEENDDGASTEDIREVELGFAKGAYRKLNSTGKKCDELIKGIYDAWYFAIYESDECKDFNRAWELSGKLDFEYSEIEDAMAKLGLPITAYYAFEDFNYTVQIVQIVYESRGVYDEIDEDMEYVRTMLKKISTENYEYTEHEDLTSYYSEVLSCLEFIKSPSGSLTQLQNRITSYETNIQTYKNKLSIAYD